MRPSGVAFFWLNVCGLESCVPVVQVGAVPLVVYQMDAPVVVVSMVGVRPLPAQSTLPGAGLTIVGAEACSVYTWFETLLVVAPFSQAIASTVTMPAALVDAALIAICETELYWSELPVQAPVALHVGVVTPSSV